MAAAKAQNKTMFLPRTPTTASSARYAVARAGEGLLLVWQPLPPQPNTASYMEPRCPEGVGDCRRLRGLASAPPRRREGAVDGRLCGWGRGRAAAAGGRLPRALPRRRLPCRLAAIGSVRWPTQLYREPLPTPAWAADLLGWPPACGAAAAAAPPPAPALRGRLAALAAALLCRSCAATRGHAMLWLCANTCQDLQQAHQKKALR